MSKRLQPEGDKKYDFAVGSDHAGFSLKERVKEYLCGEGRTILDVGIHTLKSVGTEPIARKWDVWWLRGNVKRVFWFVEPVSVWQWEQIKFLVLELPSVTTSSLPLTPNATTMPM